MSESLRNDGRIWVPKHEGRQAAARTRSRRPSATTTSSASTRASATSRRATSPRAPPSRSATRAAASARAAAASTSTSPTRSRGSGETTIEESYGNLFEMYERITGENPYEVPMRIYPAVHYTMGGLWVDYNLMSTIPGLFVLGEANFSDHGANRLGASALMQGLADGYFVLPYTIGDYLARHEARRALDADARRVRATPRRRSPSASSGCSAIKGKRTVDVVPPRARARSCGTTAAWRATRQGLEDGAGADPGAARGVLARTSACPASGAELNQSLEKAGRVADFLELGELHVPRRAGARGVVRRPLPRGAPDARRRGAARRRAASATSRPGSTPGDDAGAGAATRSRWRSRTSTWRRGATSDAMPHAARLAAEERDARPGRFVTYRGDRRQRPTCRSSRCSTSSTRS